jgi:hypothetical protein
MSTIDTLRPQTTMSHEKIRPALQDSHELGGGDQRSGEGHRTDQDVGDDEECPPAVQAGRSAGQHALPVECDEVAEGQERGRTAADGIEEGNELRHRCHRHGPRHAQPRPSAESQPADDDQPVADAGVALGHEREFGNDGDDHAGCREPVAQAGGGRRIHQMEPDDEERGTDDEGQLDQVAKIGRVHRASFAA